MGGRGDLNRTHFQYNIDISQIDSAWSGTSIMLRSHHNKDKRRNKD